MFEFNVDQQIRIQALAEANKFEVSLRTAEELVREADLIATWIKDGAQPTETPTEQ